MHTKKASRGFDIHDLLFLIRVAKEELTQLLLE